MMSTSTPAIAKMPAQVLRMILVSAFRDLPIEEATAFAPKVVSKVCSGWHTIAAETPELWSTIFIKPQTSTEDAVKMSLKLSRARPLDIYVMADDCSHSSWHAYGAMLIPHIDRWRTLNVEVSRRIHLKTIFDCFQLLKAPNLQTLMIANNTMYEDKHESAIGIQMFDAPALHRLTLVGPVHPFLINSGDHWRAVEELHIKTSHPQDIGLVQLCDALAHFRSLRRLYFDQDGTCDEDSVQEDSVSPSEVVALPALAHVSFSGLPGSFIRAFFCRIRASRLDTLTLMLSDDNFFQVSSGAIRDAFAHINESGRFPALYRVILDVPRDYRPQTFMGTMHFCTRLTLRCCFDPGMLESLAAGCSQLEWLDIASGVDVWEDFAEVLREIVERRRGSGMRLKRILVNCKDQGWIQDPAWFAENVLEFQWRQDLCIL